MIKDILHSFISKFHGEKRKKAGGASLKAKVAAATVIGMIMGTLLVSPASAHIGTSPYHLWTEHIKPWAMSLFYTKAQSNSRYYTKAQSNSRYYTTGALNVKFSRKYAQVVVVAKSGGDFTSPTVAMASITDNSSSKPYLLYIAPGVYNLGSSSLNMKQHVDVQGAGENATIIRSQVGAAFAPPNSGTVNQANNSTISRLTVENNGSSYAQTAIYSLINDKTAKANNLRIRTTGGTASYGIYTDNSSPAIEDVNIDVKGTGNANHGISNFSYNGSEPVIKDADIMVSSASYNYGIKNSNSDPTITDTRITVNGVDGWSIDFGIHGDDSSPSISDVDIRVIGGIQGWGVIGLISHSPLIRNARIRGFGASNGVGLQQASGSATIFSSEIQGGTNSIINNNAISGSVMMSSGRLFGPVDAIDGRTQCRSVMSSSASWAGDNCD